MSDKHPDAPPQYKFLYQPYTYALAKQANRM